MRGSGEGLVARLCQRVQVTSEARLARAPADLLHLHNRSGRMAAVWDPNPLFHSRRAQRRLGRAKRDFRPYRALS